jgi:hypothetical protein
MGTGFIVGKMGDAMKGGGTMGNNMELASISFRMKERSLGYGKMENVLSGLTQLLLTVLQVVRFSTQNSSEIRAVRRRLRQLLDLRNLITLISRSQMCQADLTSKTD